MSKYSVPIHAHIEVGKGITLQSAEYIEDGWYIRIEDDKITVYDIPLGGGRDEKIGVFATLEQALMDALFSRT